MSGSTPVLSPVERGRMGGRKRWGEPRVVRLDDLTAAQRRLVIALVEAARKETGPADNGPVSAEVRRVRDDSAA